MSHYEYSNSNYTNAAWDPSVQPTSRSSGNPLLMLGSSGGSNMLIGNNNSSSSSSSSNQHGMATGNPLLMLGSSGGGSSMLMGNNNSSSSICMGNNNNNNNRNNQHGIAFGISTDRSLGNSNMNSSHHNAPFPPPPGKAMMTMFGSSNSNTHTQFERLDNYWAGGKTPDPGTTDGRPITESRRAHGVKARGGNFSPISTSDITMVSTAPPTPGLSWAPISTSDITMVSTAPPTPGHSWVTPSLVTQTESPAEISNSSSNNNNHNTNNSTNSISHHDLLATIAAYNDNNRKRNCTSHDRDQPNIIFTDHHHQVSANPRHENSLLNELQFLQNLKTTSSTTPNSSDPFVDLDTLDDTRKRKRKCTTSQHQHHNHIPFNVITTTNHQASVGHSPLNDGRSSNSHQHTTSLNDLLRIQYLKNKVQDIKSDSQKAADSIDQLCQSLIQEQANQLATTSSTSRQASSSMNESMPGSGSGSSGSGSGSKARHGSPDWQKVRHWQQRLLLLHHSSRCQYEAGKCPVTPHCDKMKELWKHIANCKDPQCSVHHCMSSRYVLSHYRRCKDAKCPSCGPVRETIRRKSHEKEKNSSRPASGSKMGFDDDISQRSSRSSSTAKEEETPPPNPPEGFVCPLTHDVMIDPVIDKEGNTYERSSIVEWLTTKTKTSPITRNALRVKHLVPNRALKQSIDEWKEENKKQQQQRRQLDAMNNNNNNKNTVDSSMLLNHASGALTTIQQSIQKLDDMTRALQQLHQH